MRGLYFDIILFFWFFLFGNLVKRKIGCNFMWKMKRNDFFVFAKTITNLKIESL